MVHLVGAVYRGDVVVDGVLRHYKPATIYTNKIIRDWGNGFYWMVEMMLSGVDCHQAAAAAEWHPIDTGIRLDYFSSYLTGAFGCWGHVSSGDWIGNTYYAEFIGGFRRHEGGYVDRQTGEIVVTNNGTWYNNFALGATGADADDTILLQFYNSSTTQNAGPDAMNIYVRLQKSYHY